MVSATILVGTSNNITDIYVNSFQRMLRDGNFRPEELSAIAFGYTKLLEESNESLPVAQRTFDVVKAEHSLTLRADAKAPKSSMSAGTTMISWTIWLLSRSPISAS